MHTTDCTLHIAAEKTGSGGMISVLFVQSCERRASIEEKGMAGAVMLQVLVILPGLVVREGNSHVALWMMPGEVEREILASSFT